MSFLKDIEAFQAKNLRKTDTVVMTPDGRRLMETKDDRGCYQQQSIGTGISCE